MKRSHSLLALTCLVSSALAPTARAQQVLFRDNFSSTPTIDISAGAGAPGRQSGSYAPLTYAEAANTSAGGAFNWTTQINPSWSPNTLILFTAPSWKGSLVDLSSLGYGVCENDWTWASPKASFTAAEHFQISYTAGIYRNQASSSSWLDHWAGIEFGSDHPGTFVLGAGTGMIFRDNGFAQFFNNGAVVGSANIGLWNTLTFDVATSPLFNGSGTTTWSLSVNGGAPVFTYHRLGGYNGNYITLQDNSLFRKDRNGNYLQDTGLGLFSNFKVAAVTPEPGTYAMIASLGLTGAAFLRRKRAR